MPVSTLNVDSFVSFTLAILLLFVGKELTQRFAGLRSYSIPEPVVGGFLCTVVIGLVYWLGNVKIIFDLHIRDLLLLYFFAGIGLKSEVSTLLKGGRPLMVLLALSATFIVLQNMLGMGVANIFGLDPRAGLLVGSVSLVGVSAPRWHGCLISSSGWVSTTHWRLALRAACSGSSLPASLGGRLPATSCGSTSSRRPMTPGWKLVWHTTPTAAKHALITTACYAPGSG